SAVTAQSSTPSTTPGRDAATAAVSGWVSIVVMDAELTSLLRQWWRGSATGMNAVSVAGRHYPSAPSRPEIRRSPSVVHQHVDGDRPEHQRDVGDRVGERSHRTLWRRVSPEIDRRAEEHEPGDPRDHPVDRAEVGGGDEHE